MDAGGDGASAHEKERAVTKEREMICERKREELRKKVR